MNVEVEEQLQREAAAGRRAAAASIGAVVLQIAAQAVFQLVSAERPGSSPGDVLATPAFYRDNAVALIAGAALVGIAYVLAGLALAHLYNATRFRRPETPGVARVMALVGPVAFAIAVVASQVLLTLASVDYLAHHRGDYFAARELISSAPVSVAQGVALAGTLALAFAFVLISLNAMRAGLLTRFMGILGIIVGVLLVLPIGSPVPIVQWFWLAALGYLLLGRWPGGVPSAWRTGRAEPWPTTQELRERREAERGQTPEDADSPSSVPDGSEAGSPPARPHPSSRKRKGRKRR